jgi:peroxiredoxin Q/BCP
MKPLYGIPVAMFGRSLLILLAVLAMVIPASGEEPMKKSKAFEAGDKAPMFELVGSDGKTHRLEDHIGKRPVVIAWFPKAFTGG